jgi:hypothetical protein
VIARARRRDGTLGRTGRRLSPETDLSVKTEAGGLDVSLDPAAPAGRRQSSSGKCTRCAPACPAGSFLGLAECCDDQAAEEDEGERFESHFALLLWFVVRLVRQGRSGWRLLEGVPLKIVQHQHKLALICAIHSLPGPVPRVAVACTISLVILKMLVNRHASLEQPYPSK